MLSVTHRLYNRDTKTHENTQAGPLVLILFGDMCYMGVGYELTLLVALSYSHLDNQFLEGSMSHLSCLLPKEMLNHCSLLTDSLLLFKLLYCN